GGGHPAVSDPGWRGLRARLSRAFGTAGFHQCDARSQASQRGARPRQDHRRSPKPVALRLVQGALAGGSRGTRERNPAHLGRVQAMKDSIRISEIFGPTIQGEGPLIGRPTVFVRTGGCDYRCSWCDTLYAVLPEYRDEWTPMTPRAIMARVNELAGGEPVLISLSGGNPALQPLALCHEDAGARRRAVREMEEDPSE